MYGEVDINVYQVLSTQQKDCTETPQAGCIIVVFCASNLQPCLPTHIPIPREMSQLCSALRKILLYQQSQGGVFDCMCVEGRGV